MLFNGGAADPRHHGLPAGRAVRPRGTPSAAARSGRTLRPADLCHGQGPSRPHIEAAKALYSIPGGLIGQRVDVRADRQLVKVFHRGVLVKTHPRQPPGHRSTDPDDLPAHKSIYAMRDLDRLVAMAAHGPAIGAYAQALLDNPLPWTKMRQVYALLGLVKKWGAERVDAACARPADAEASTSG